VCAFLAAQPTAPIIFCPGGTIHGSRRWIFPQVYGEGLLGRLRSLYGPVRQLQLAERVALRRAAGVIAVSGRVRDQMLRIQHQIAQKVRVIYSGGDFSQAGPPERILPAALPGGLTALTVARLDAIKNLAHLLRAWKLVRWSPRRLWIAGNGPQMESLQELAGSLGLTDNVVFLGERLDIRGLLERADVFVLPSLYEACPLALLEAMTTGLPSVTLASVPGISNVAASGELNVDGVTGFVVDPTDPAAMAARLDMLASDDPLRQRMGQAAASRAQEHFTWSRAASAYLAAAQEALAGRALRPQAKKSWRLANA
jgi:glycosyltransferase involved in cell wall biosynthesis